MIRMTCPNCEAKLNVKRKLIGQTRDCPNCGVPLLIRADETLVVAGGTSPAPAPFPPTPSAPEPLPPTQQSAAEESAVAIGPERLATHQRLEKLNRQNHYLVCDRAKVVAHWQANGDGWMLKTHAGLVSAARNRDQVPSQGLFKLIELKMQVTETGRRLVGLMTYQLVERYALVGLERGDDKICAKIAGAGSLSAEQKTLIRVVIKEQLMYEIWKDAANVLEYLGNTDYHSPGVG
jgi:hypothetical protein